MLLVVACRLERDWGRDIILLSFSRAPWAGLSVRFYTSRIQLIPAKETKTPAVCRVSHVCRIEKQKSYEMYIKFNGPQRNIAKVVLEFTRAMKGENRREIVQSSSNNC